jgi:hypothetical protein
MSIDPRTRLLLTICFQKRKTLFWALYVFPVGASIIATVIFPKLWFAYYFLGLPCSLFGLIKVVSDWDLRVSEDNWGRFERDTQPIRYWMNQGIWTLAWLIVSSSSVLVALQKRLA